MKPKKSKAELRAEAQERLNEVARKTDWWGICRICGQRLDGSVADIKAHKHGESS